MNHSIFGSAEVAEDVHQGRERPANDSLCCFESPLKPQPVCLSAVRVEGQQQVRV